ncbi:MAG: DNA repair protein RecN [Zavarzinella sp.]
MLREITVQNLALIEDVHIELEPGFCAWTGETGAGKSLLLGALGLLLGDRGRIDLIRSGAEELKVTGVFELRHHRLLQAIETILEETLQPAELIITRKVSKWGNSKAYLNHEPVTLNLLKKVGELLVDVHGQREHHSLLEPTYQIQLLDSYGNLQELRLEYDRTAVMVRDFRKQIEQQKQVQANSERELQLLNFEKEELEAAAIKPRELPQLESEYQTLANSQSIQEYCHELQAILYDDDGSVVERFGQLEKSAHPWQHFSDDFADIVQQLHALALQTRSVVELARAVGDRSEPNPERMAEIEVRMELIKRLEIKYRRPADQLPGYLLQVQQKLDSFERATADSKEIVQRLAVAFADLVKQADLLRTQRIAVGKKLIKATEKYLQTLGMPQAKLSCSFHKIDLGTNPLAGPIPSGGADQMDFLLAANPGEEARPLRKIASGGEMSRTMLALKTVLAEHDMVGTLVFDEIDANVGGRLGDIVGQRLAALGKSHQVICVTHLPQVAAYATHQWGIRKTIHGKKTITTITQLRKTQDRIEELASMLRGEAKSASTKKEAKEMLLQAQQLSD